MNATMLYYGPWQIPIACRNALCPDGRRRRARITGQPDTWFSIPASVNVRGKTVTGFVTGRKTDGAQDYEFRPSLYHKNASLLAKESGK